MDTKKSTTKISGIYKITNTVNGKYYIGSSNDIMGTHGRWCEHINGLNANRHENSYLQRSWNKYGQSNFNFTILENVPKSNLLIVEQKYLDIAKKEGKQKCYNLSFIATGGWNKEFKHKEETKRKISEKLKGRPSPMKGMKRPGLKSSRCDHTIYTFKNLKTNEIFKGKRYEFYTKFQLNRVAIDHLINKKSKTSYNWILIQ